MAEVVTREVVDDGRHGPSWLSWLAMAVATAALIIAWLAYNRSGEDLEAKIRNQVNESIQSSQQTVDEAELNQDSSELREEVETPETTDTDSGDTTVPQETAE